ncbi:probable NAD(P)H dehydrogenase subunit CRR3, chloroplastic isoform X1 [Cucumis melo]|uniref:Probable NAD(P)H dehydrogenase subunit CRR3, chloroplastic isoform X1 n=2 Tax=Cucumis melo TaxID=3656 RepID=A0A1S3CM65_CUCME|nr:probable NAD(P)H dehydrogenase subunit CRR3, chloroplastic isoform X1 [Cucumis melo]XP_050947415.1 probable NAD(P)H dehydrogenase subunit CRR3, chloroplastic isoform X1 [Cucumis melo]
MQLRFLICGTPMASLFSISITKNVALASLNPNRHSHSHSHSPPLKTNDAADTIPIKTPRLRPKLLNPRRPSVIEIERAIGGGRFRDADPRDLEEDKKAAFDMFLMSFTGKYEGPLMKKLRETGEWVTNQTETKFQASGKWFLLFTFQWVLPFWALSLLVASGVIKLPFNTPFLNELLM